MAGLEFGRRVYGFWARHVGAYTLLTRGVLLGKDAELRNEAVDLLQLRPGDAVLDLACGPGTNLARLEQAVGLRGRVVEVDYSEQMLVRARDAVAREGWRNVEVVQGDAARMSLADDSLDGALCTLGLSAMPEPEAAIRQVHRCLKAGGRFAVVDARLPEGSWQVVNPLLRAVFVPSTNWNTSVDLTETMGQVFGNVKGRKMNRGSVFLAVSAKQRQ
jgi:demethylmenaquinone methyltransferase/2-methoxy-6-polyprenyl-1,4-benzoquinol methylase